MKTQRGRRRKLRFNSTKDAVAVVTVKVECAPNQPRERRKRQQHPRRVNPVPSHPSRIKTHVNGLPTATWNGIQAQFAAAKSLGEITRTMLQFFKEHEILQGSASGPAFPLFVPSSDIYKMKVLRKRRIYDVLHVLEGIGVIKRVRCNDTQKAKAGFLYNGKAAVVQHLAEMQRNAARVMVNFRQSRGLSPVSIVEEDGAIVKVVEDLATTEKWPCLVNTTICFLGLLFQQDYQVGVALPNMSARLIEAKKFIGALVPLMWNEASCKDVHRRVYDVASVLESCSLIFTSATAPTSLKSSFNKRNPRKSVRFNYDIFTDPSVLFAARSSDAMWNTSSQENELESTNAFFGAVCKTPKLRAREDHLVSPPWHRMHTVTTMTSSPIFPQADPRLSDTCTCEKTRWKSPPFNETKTTAIDTSWNVQPKYRPEPLPSFCVRAFFSPLGKEPTEKNEWDDESLKLLGQYDAPPVQEKIDWYLNKHYKETFHEEWGQCPGANACFASIEVPPDQVWADSVQTIGYHEVLVDDCAKTTANFLC